MTREELAAFLRTRCHGRKNAMKAEELKVAAHTDGSQIREQVNALRCRGFPIASGKEGYFYAETAGEIYATIRSLRKLQAGVEKAIVGLEGALADFGERQDPVGGRDG